MIGVDLNLYPRERLRKLQRFHRKIALDGLGPLRSKKIEIFQVNLGKMCNQTCKHCHVDACPDRREMMTRETMELCKLNVKITDFCNLTIILANEK